MGLKSDWQAIVRKAVLAHGEAGGDSDWGRYFEMASEQFDSLVSNLRPPPEICERSGLPYFLVGRISIRRADPTEDILSELWKRKATIATESMLIAPEWK